MVPNKAAGVTSRRACLFGVTLLLAAAGCGDGLPADPATMFSGPTMGTTYTVKLARLPADTTLEQIQRQIDEQLEAINQQMSTYREDSELSRFNRSTDGDWFEVSAATAQVVTEALRVSGESDGAFDVTVAPLVNLWNFGPARGYDRIPSEAEIAAAKAKVGYRHLEVRGSPPALRKSIPDVTVDLSAIAKGFAVDQVARSLESLDVPGYLVEIGGELRSYGTKPDGSRWRIGIESPEDNRRVLDRNRVIDLSGQSMATSGDYRAFFEIEGKRYSHTIDPRTGAPAEHALASATVVADSCMQADALATTLMVLGPDKGFDWAVAHDLAALFIVRDGSEFVDKMTPGFEALFASAPADSLTNSRAADRNYSKPLPTASGSTGAVFLIALALFAVAMLGMAIGVIVGNRKLRGTCGGLAGLKDAQGRPMCDACTTPSETCTGVDSQRRGEFTGRTEDDAQESNTTDRNPSDPANTHADAQ